MIHVPRIHSCELHVTYRCNLRCSHCHNLISAAPCNEDMPVSWLYKMLNDSVHLKYPWEWLVIHGGEPTLHPDFTEICKMLAHYKQIANPSVELKLSTNGVGDAVMDGIKTAKEYGIEIYNSDKGVPDYKPPHAAVLSSPMDCGEHYNEGCYQSSECGICYTPRGFYECSPAGAAWRLFHYEPVCVDLKDVTAEKMAEAFKEHCRHCGYARNEGKREWVMNSDAPITATWQKAIDEYKSEQETV